jgi:ketosteroid isomerase-like protein
MSQTSGAAEDLAAIGAVIFRYSRAMDACDWALMDQVFTEDAEIAMGEIRFAGRAAGVEAIRACIECCSATHHMNSNILVEFEADGARVVSNFRAWHKGVGARAGEVFEAMGTYTDSFVRTAEGWRIAVREEASPIVLGDPEFFATVAPVWERLLGRSGARPLLET